MAEAAEGEFDLRSLDEAELIAHVKKTLAGYKAPKRILPVPSIDRGVNGKVDYRRWSDYAIGQLSN